MKEEILIITLITIIILINFPLFKEVQTELLYFFNIYLIKYLLLLCIVLLTVYYYNNPNIYYYQYLIPILLSFILIMSITLEETQLVKNVLHLIKK
jgi:hypothetical protein